MDPTIVVALISTVGVFLTAAGAVVVAVVTNRKEKAGSAESAIEATLRERISLKDEIIDAKEDRIDELVMELKQVREALHVAQVQLGLHPREVQSEQA